MKNVKSMDYMGAIIGLKKVIDLQSFSKASVEIGISQPALSKRVKNLEYLYNEVIIKKQNGKIKLTAIGEIIYEEATQFEQINKQTINKINEVKQNKPIAEVGLMEQLYLNYEETLTKLNYKYVHFKNINSLRRSFDYKNIESILVIKNELNLFMHQKHELIKQIKVKLFVHKNNKMSKISLKEVREMEQLYYQPHYIASLFPEFLNKNNLLSNKFEYIENLEVIVAELSINPHKIWLVTENCKIDDKYLAKIKELEISLPTIDLYLLTK